MKTFNLITAFCKNIGIGNNNSIPWHFKEELQHFSNITKSVNSFTKLNALIMGKNTFLSLKNPLPDRINIVITKDKTIKTKGITIFDNVNNAINHCSQQDYIENVFFIGGTNIYKEALMHKLDNIYVTQIDKFYNCDTFFPIEELNKFLEENEHNLYTMPTMIINNTKLFYSKYNIIYNRDETRYLNLLTNILKTGDERQTRNAITYSTFGSNLEFDLSKGLPVLTTKKMFIRGIIEELLFFIRGDTNSNLLANKKVNIWKPNTSKEFLKSRNLNYQEGDMGPMYGFQWRHFGTNYNGFDDSKKFYDPDTNELIIEDGNYLGLGYDQLRNVIDLLINDPTSRRIMMTTFNPADVDKSVLAPCHGLIIQFYTTSLQLEPHSSTSLQLLDSQSESDFAKQNQEPHSSESFSSPRSPRQVSCKMYQRSADMFLGVPFNITSYAILLELVALITGYKPGKLYMSFGDCHIYKDHIEQVKLLTSRKPYKFPKLEFNNLPDLSKLDTVDKKIEFLENLKYEDFKLVGYESHPIIKAKMIA